MFARVSICCLEQLYDNEQSFTMDTDQPTIIITATLLVSIVFEEFMVSSKKKKINKNYQQ